MLACECSIILAFPVVPLEKKIFVGAVLNDFTDLKREKKNNKDFKKMCYVKNGNRDIGQLVKQVGNLKAGCLE